MARKRTLPEVCSFSRQLMPQLDQRIVQATQMRRLIQTIIVFC
jgi:hypothetical protein